MKKKIGLMALVLSIALLSGCGSSSSSDDLALLTVAQATAQNDAQKDAIDKIANYAEDGGTPPTVEDYEAAGVEGVTAENLDEINETVARLTSEDVDTQEEIQDTLDELEITLAQPVLLLNGDNPQTVILGDAYIEAGATAEDSEDGDLTSSIVTDAEDVDTSTVGVYNATYTVVDSDGNSVTQIRKVNVVSPDDITPPVITILGKNPQSISKGTTYTDAGATAKDDRDGDLTSSIETIDNVDTSKVGKYEVTYTVEDIAGNKATVTRIVNVVSISTPVVTLDGDDHIIIVVDEEEYVEEGATAEDDRDGDMTDSIEITGSVDETTLGEYILTYTATNNAGNEGSTTRTVNVVERFTRDTDTEIVTDNLADLMWQDTLKNKDVNITWKEADSVCADSLTGGLSGWRLPTLDELTSIIDPDKEPAEESAVIYDAFQNVSIIAWEQWYWTSETDEFDEGVDVNFYDGGDGSWDGNDRFRCVRDSNQPV